jgi:hypothetical protein
MSEPLRIALVAEGPTEKILIEAVLSSILADRSFVLRQLQPEESLPFGTIGTGWVGVYRWCRQVVMRTGSSLRQDVLYKTYDILVLQLDADVAEKRYADGSIQDAVQDLPCNEPCPPPRASTDPLRRVLLRWAGEHELPPNTVLCTPSKSTEAWVVAALFPGDDAVRRGIECLPDAEARLRQQPLASRIHKRLSDYQARATELSDAWPRLVETLDEAKRFDTQFRAVLH